MRLEFELAYYDVAIQPVSNYTTETFQLFSLHGSARNPYNSMHETDCISHSTNTLGKGMNPIILPQAMGK